MHPQQHTPPVTDSTNDDESVRVDIAVKALGDMRSRASVPATSSGRASSRSSRNGEQDDSQQQQPPRDFVTRMSSIPLVETAIRVYEHGKASSKVVKYGAKMVESSVKTISKPVMNRLPVNQIDEFACRQLDKLDKYRRPSVGPEPNSPRSPPVSPSRSNSSTSRRMSEGNDAASSSTSIDPEIDRGRPRLATKTFDGSPNPRAEERVRESREEEGQDCSVKKRQLTEKDGSVPQWIESTTSRMDKAESGAPSPMDDSRTSSPILVEDKRTQSPSGFKPSDQPTPQLRQRYPHNDRQIHSPPQPQNSQSQNPDRQVAQRSRWQAMLLEAGGLGVALSDENMRRLKYCLNWLLFATAHIDAQILILRDFIESIQPLRQPRSSSSSQRRPPISEEQLRKLTEVRKDIVSTVRQMVDVVSKYAGGALPEPARGRVRGFILKLPQRWASRTAAAGVGASSASSAASVSVVPTNHHHHHSNSVTGGGERETVAAAGSSTGVLRRGQGRDKRAAQRERGTGSRASSPAPPETAAHSAHSSISGQVLGQQQQSQPPQQQQLSHSNATVAAQRILTLATESLDMMRNVTGVVTDSLDRADAWVNRLRMVGVQRANHQNATSDDALNEEFGPLRVGSQSDYSTTCCSSSTNRDDDYRTLFHKHRRGGSTSSSIVVQGEEETSTFSPGSSPASPFMTAMSSSSVGGYTTMSTTASMSSIPSTPASMREYHHHGVANAPSPGTIPLASMHITSKYNTPKSGVACLPVDEDGDGDGGGGGGVVEMSGLGLGLRKTSSRRSSLLMEVDS